MPKARAVTATARKTSAGRKKTATVRKPATPRAPAKARAPRRSSTASKAAPAEAAAPGTKEPVVAPPQASKPPIEDAQSQVVASKFASAETTVETAAPKPRPSLPASYGESHLLLLVRDPQTLFAAWDVAPSTIEALKARLGRRGFAVSNLTLRLTRAGGGTSVVHVGKKARSRYLKIEGGPSFMAEVGFTTPAGRFELVARSAPCFVPMGPVARQESFEAGRRAVLGYREAMAVARKGGVAQNPGRGSAPGAARARALSTAGGAASAAGARVLGGASDLYRR